MNFDLNTENENPLYRNYLNTVEDNKWLKPIDLKLPFPSKSFTTYTQEEFLEKIETDKEFNEMWGIK